MTLQEVRDLKHDATSMKRRVDALLRRDTLDDDELAELSFCTLRLDEMNEQARKSWESTWD